MESCRSPDKCRYRCRRGSEIWESPLVTVSAAVAAMVGGYAGKITGGTFFVDGNAVLAGPGEPLGAFIAAFAGITCGHLVSGKTKVDIIVTPVITIGAGSVVGLLVGSPISQMMTGLGSIINWATEQRPFIMGIVVSVVMGMVLTLPISSAALGIILNLSGLAAGAATIGCCCNMVGFAVASYRENKFRRPCRTGSWNLDAPGAEHHASSTDLAARHLLECDFGTPSPQSSPICRIMQREAAWVPQVLSDRSQRIRR